MWEPYTILMLVKYLKKNYATLLDLNILLGIRVLYFGR
jgi:hypothetical protein